MGWVEKGGKNGELDDFEDFRFPDCSDAILEQPSGCAGPFCCIAYGLHGAKVDGYSREPSRGAVVCKCILEGFTGQVIALAGICGDAN